MELKPEVMPLYTFRENLKFIFSGCERAVKLRCDYNRNHIVEQVDPIKVLNKVLLKAQMYALCCHKIFQTILELFSLHDQ